MVTVQHSQQRHDWQTFCCRLDLISHHKKHAAMPAAAGCSHFAKACLQWAQTWTSFSKRCWHKMTIPGCQQLSLICRCWPAHNGRIRLHRRRRTVHSLCCTVWSAQISDRDGHRQVQIIDPGAGGSAAVGSSPGVINHLPARAKVCPAGQKCRSGKLGIWQSGGHCWQMTNCDKQSKLCQRH